jgi:lipoprotein-anchoring transpeptidase ErfK/SrfK
MAGRHARPDSGRGGAAWRLTGAIAGIIALGSVAIVGGVAFGLASPWTGSTAVASIVSPSPAEDEGFEMTVPGEAPAITTATLTREAMGAEPRRVYSPDVNVLRWDSEPAVISTVYPTRVKDRYGVGTVIRIQFTYPVPDEQKPLLEQAATVITSKPVGVAAWSWPNDTTLAYRPKEFWPAYTDVKVKFAWEKNKLANYDPDIDFRIGRSLVFKMSANDLVGKVKRDGVVIRRVPVSLGKPTWETASGVKTIMERYAMKRMVNPGPREPYDVNVPFALRITPGGEYLHAAPWNLYNLGRASTSHGCTNMSMEDGKWFYDNAFEGDPVITTGTGVKLDWFEGPGAMWNIGWADWTKRSFSLA